MKVCITGAAGRLGREVLKLIPEAIPLVRSRSELKNEIQVDFKDHEKLKAALRGCEVLIHTAGSNKFYDERDLEEGNFQLTKRLLDALPEKTKVIFASSVSVYGKDVNGSVDERTPSNPDSAYSRTKYEAEKLVMKRKNSIALRIAAMYGPQYPDYVRFMRMIRKGRMFVLGDGRNFVSFVHVSDVAKAVSNSLRAKPGIYLLSGEGVMQKDIYELAAKELGTKPPKIRIPLRMGLLFAELEEKKAEVFGGKPSITREHILILGKSRVFDCKKARKELGFAPRPLEQGIKELVGSA